MKSDTQRAPVLPAPDWPQAHLDAIEAIATKLPSTDQFAIALLVKELRASLASKEPPVSPDEPVAWTLTETLRKRQTTTRANLWFTDPQNTSWTPLYARAALPAGNQRTTLTDEQILHVWDTHVGDPVPKYPFTDADKIAFARALLALG